MIPILYPPEETVFDNNGLGALSEAVSCTVTEERNGLYELELQYPRSGIRFGDLARRCLIWAKPDPVSQAQPFRIYRISKEFGQNVTVCAEHISYDLSGVTISPFTASSAADAMSRLQSGGTQPHPFTFWTDNTARGQMVVDRPSSLRALLGGHEGSVLDVYGGEWAFDRFAVRLYAQRGADHGVCIRYGKNLTDLKQEENISSLYNGVHPYWADTDGNLVELPEKIVYAPGGRTFSRVMTLDLSQEWQEAPTEQQLREKAQDYIKANEIGIPKVSLKVSFVQLEQTEEYKNIAALERVALCDTVNVEFPALQVSAQAKCVKTVYDVLNERYTSVELGERTASIADTIADQVQTTKEKPSASWMTSAILQLTARLLGAHGGAIRLLDTDGDGAPDTLYIADHGDPLQAVKVWRFNYEGWGVSRTGIDGPYVMGATLEDGLLAEMITAAQLTAGYIQSADGGKTFFLDLDKGILRGNFESLTLASKAIETQESAESRAADVLSAAGTDAVGKAAAALEAAKGYTDGQLENYPTTVVMASAIQQSAQGITATVEKTYATKDSLGNYTEIGKVRSAFAMDASSVTVESGSIKFTGNTLVVDTTNFKLDANGDVSIIGNFTSTSDDRRIQMNNGSIICSYYRFGKDNKQKWMKSLLIDPKMACFPYRPPEDQTSYRFEGGSVAVYNDDNPMIAIEYNSHISSGGGLFIITPYPRLAFASSAYIGSNKNQSLDFAASNEPEYRMHLGVTDAQWALHPATAYALGLGTSTYPWGAAYVRDLYVYDSGNDRPVKARWSYIESIQSTVLCME